MPKKQSLIANMIDIADKEAQYDRQSKRLLSMTVILAWILKSCVDEFRDFSIAYITNNCFVGKPEVMVHALHADHVDSMEEQQTQKIISRLNRLLSISSSRP